jgi:hypothetical protein
MDNNDSCERCGQRSTDALRGDDRAFKAAITPHKISDDHRKDRTVVARADAVQQLHSNKPPFACAVAVIRWGAETSSEKLRQCARCAVY